MTEKHSTNGMSQTETVSQPTSADEPKDNPKDLKREASWPAVLFYIHLNILGIYGVVVLFTQTSLITALFSELRPDPFSMSASSVNSLVSLQP